MSHMIAGIDVHKKMLAVVAADSSQEGESELQRRKFGTTPGDLRKLAEWLTALQVQEVVMESTAQYWRPVWQELEGKFHLELAQAQSNRGPRGRKSDFRDVERLWRRYVADELILSFVPDPEQRLWRTLSRMRVRLARDRSRAANRLEALLEEMRIKLTSKVSDVQGVSSLRILHGIADGKKGPQELAEMVDPHLRVSKQELAEILEPVGTLDERYRKVLKQILDQLALNEKQSKELQKELAESLNAYGEQVSRLAEVPGLGVESAQQIIAEVGPTAEKFPTAGNLSSWVGVCPGQNESAERSASDHSAHGNTTMRRILDQAANAAVKAKGTAFQARYHRIRGRDPKKHNVAIWAVAHHLCRVIWSILHKGVTYQEKGHRPDPRAVKQRANRLLRKLKALGYQVQITPNQAVAPA
jgi:transposase